MTTEKQNAIRKILENYTYKTADADDIFEYEMYCEYNEALTDNELVAISKSDNPSETFDDIITDIYNDKRDWYLDDIIHEIESNESIGELTPDDIEWIEDHLQFTLDTDHFNQDVHVAITLDTGDADSDFTQCNILNWYGIQNENPITALPEKCPLTWLARQFNKLDEVNAALKMIATGHDPANTVSEFTQSIISELENTSAMMNTLTFCVTMSLKDFIILREAINEKKDTLFTVSKDTTCGLYDIWNGGGSVMDICLENDITIPSSVIWNAWIDQRGNNANGYGYNVDDTYGFTPSAWKGACTPKTNTEDNK